MKREGITAEAFRSLRTSMQFASNAAENNIIVISGPSPSVGKSFITSNIGIIMAESGNKVLVIDGDMRRGHLHKYMGVKKSPGLSELIGTDIDVEEVVTEINENMSFIPAGRNPSNPAELLMTDKFHSLLAAFSKHFDAVVIDTPPILAVTDASIIARDAAQLYILLGYGKHRMKEIKSAITRFEQNGIHVTGTIMNDVDMKSTGKTHDDYYYYAYK
jgi:tyrosine-protein kinase Etk/Wzc